MARIRNRDKEWRFARILAEARGFGLEVEEVDKDKPWGGYVRFNGESLDGFRRAYWRDFLSEHWQEELDEYFQRVSEGRPELSLEAKLLLVAPGQRLSLQSHERRAELWRVLEGPVVVVMGGSQETLGDLLVRAGEAVKIPCGTYHRLTAPATSWGVVAEFWQHEDPNNPSDEDDITRYDDDDQVRSESWEGRGIRPE